MSEPTIDNYGHDSFPVSAKISYLIGEGWVPLVVELCERLAETEADNPDWRVYQVKEKFGTLRFYTSGITEAGYDAIAEAERKSAKTCEWCGAPGTLDESKWWMLTLCDLHKGERRAADEVSRIGLIQEGLEANDE